MPTRLRNTILLLLLCAASLGTWLLQPDRGRPAAVTTDAGEQRGYYMNDAVFSGLDDQGRVVYRLAAARIEGADDSDFLSLRDVEIRYSQDQDVPWRISAQSASSQRNQEMLELEGVVIETEADELHEYTRIEAETIQFEPELRLARTAGPVSIAVGNGRVEAMGLTADLSAEHISLESGVRGRIAP